MATPGQSPPRHSLQLQAGRCEDDVARTRGRASPGRPRGRGQWVLLTRSLCYQRRMELKDLRQQMMAAMKAGRTVEKEALRTAIGEITTVAARENRDATAADVEAVVRKLVKGVQETLSLAREEQKTELSEELAIFAALLPQTLSVEQIVDALAPVADAIAAAANDGQATGVAMKHLKSAGAAVQGQDVRTAVGRMRGS
jgi:uncharacterized protein YqeY